MKDRRKAEQATDGVSPRSQDDTGSDESRRKERFARALAQAEFGRFYWDDRLETELRRQLAASKQRHAK